MTSGDIIIEFPEGSTNSEGKEIAAGTAGELEQRIENKNVLSQNDDSEGNENELKMGGNESEGQKPKLRNALNIENTQFKSEEMNTGDEIKHETNSESPNSSGTLRNERDTSDKNEKFSASTPKSSGESQHSNANERQNPEETGIKTETDSKLVSNSNIELIEFGDISEKLSDGELQAAGKERKEGEMLDDESPLQGAKGSSRSPSRHGLESKQRQQEEWEEFVSSLSKELQEMMGGCYASEDTERYLDGYPEAEDNPKLNLNLKFYLNQIESEPNGDNIDNIHRHWKGNYDWLERHHDYIQWLFPIQEQGLNKRAHPLQKHEIEELRQNKHLKDRLIRSYELILDFFGMKLVDKESGKIARSDNNQQQQYALLNSSFHNYLRITRILTCLGEFGLEKYQAPFCEFVLSEISENNQLKNALKSCLSYWGKVIKDFDARESFYEKADTFVREQTAKKSAKQRQQKEWKDFVSGLSKELQEMMGGHYASEDTERYLDGYPEAEDNPKLNLNLEFYRNQIESEPNGDFIDNIHKKWKGNYDWLEQHHDYIQWLFPIQEHGLNKRAHPLQKHEIEELRQDKHLEDRLIRSYELILDFFGMKLVDKYHGVIARSFKNRKQQYALLNSSSHNCLRITRILKCLGEFGLEKYQAPFCQFVLCEIFENNQLTNTLKSCLSYWGKLIKDFETRKSFYEIANSFVQVDLAKNGDIENRGLNNLWPKLKQDYMLPLWRRVKVATSSSTPPLAPPLDTSSVPLSDVITSEPKQGTALSEEKESVAETGENKAQVTEDTNLSSQNGATGGNNVRKMENETKKKTDPNSELPQANDRKKMCKTETELEASPESTSRSGGGFICNLLVNNAIN